MGGFYYVKSYPGRSSHVSFLPKAPVGWLSVHPGKGYGTVLAKTYLEYTLRLSYQASVFNLVYANNNASVK